jgi:hypothetical protein
LQQGRGLLEPRKNDSGTTFGGGESTRTGLASASERWPRRFSKELDGPAGRRPGLQRANIGCLRGALGESAGPSLILGSVALSSAAPTVAMPTAMLEQDRKQAGWSVGKAAWRLGVSIREYRQIEPASGRIRPRWERGPLR